MAVHGKLAGACSYRLNGVEPLGYRQCQAR
jgi:hypothetical protein